MDQSKNVSILPEVVDANNNLGLSLLKVLAQEKENVFISPFSLSTALTMVCCGTRGNTYEELLRVLGYNNDSLCHEDLSNAFQQLLSTLKGDSEGYVLAIANSLVKSKIFSVKDDYNLLLAHYFQACFFEADFSLERKQAIQLINNWVKDKTNGMIPQLVKSLEPNTVLVILNAIYFKGTWLRQFTKKETSSQKFYNKGLEKNGKKVQMMHMKESFEFVEKENLKALQLSYVGKEIAMLVLLPSDMQGLEQLEQQLTPSFLQDLRNKMQKRKVKVSLPKFRLEYSKSLKETFKVLGLKDIFEYGANFSGISDRKDLCVSHIVHKAVIEVNEEGSEAVAATAVVVKARCLVRDPEFTVDHPFLFTIFDTRNNLILFLGRIDKL